MKELAVCLIDLWEFPLTAKTCYFDICCHSSINVNKLHSSYMTEIELRILQHIKIKQNQVFRQKENIYFQ